MSENSTAKGSILARLGRAAGWSAWVIVGLLGISTVLVLLLVASVSPDATQYFTQNTVGQLVLNASLYLVAIGVVIGLPYWLRKYVLRKPSEPGAMRRLLGLDQSIRWRHLGLFSLCIVGYLAGTLLISSLANLLPGFNADQKQDIGFENVTGVVGLLLAFIALVILPPIAEELLFRGYLFGKLRRENGFWLSAIITSIIFGLVHLQWNVGIDVFVLSIFLCILREKTGSLWMSMLLHGLKNGVAYFFLFIGPLIGINLV